MIGLLKNEGDNYRAKNILLFPQTFYFKFVNLINPCFMKRALLILVGFMFSLTSNGQPIIEGDTMMCPWTNGTAALANGSTYDSYQWYYKYWFTSDPYVAIEGATGPSFTYDWYTYDQALLKLVVTMAGNTFESNVLQIDSYAWTSMFVSYDLGSNAQYDPDTDSISLCDGTALVMSINNPPYNSNIVWTRDGVEIPEATNSSYAATEPGTYQVSAAPGFCPDSESTSLPITITINSDCNLAVPDNDQNISIYPNPADTYIEISSMSDVTAYQIADMTGKIVQAANQIDNSRISIEGLAAGIYLIRLGGESTSSTHKIIKK